VKTVLNPPRKTILSPRMYRCSNVLYAGDTDVMYWSRTANSTNVYTDQEQFVDCWTQECLWRISSKIWRGWSWWW